MPGSGFLTFTDGQVLTAAQVNGYLMKQAVMYFATTAARTSGLPSPEEGMVTYLADTDDIQFWNGTAWVDLIDATTAQTVAQKTLVATEERWNVVASASTGTINVNFLTANAWYYTTNATANWTLNFRGDASNTLNSLISVGDSVTIAFAAAQGATPYRPTTFQIDGSAVTPLWQGGTAPTAGNANSTDLYVFSIVKTAATPTYVVFGSQTRFA